MMTSASFRRSIPILAAALSLAVFPYWSRPACAAGFGVTNLITDDPSANPAVLTDPHLKNAWGVSFSPTSPFWVSNNGTGLATLYQVNAATDAPTKVGLEVTIPDAGTVTGQVNNPVGAGAFNGDNFLFVSEDGTISGWRGALGTTAERLQLPNPSNTSYKGTTAASVGGHGYLYSANFHTGNIDILKGDGGAPDLAGHLTDPGLPSGYAPFNIQNLGGTIYVTYALKGEGNEDDPGAGHGFVSQFDLNGNFLARIASQGTLNSPWGLAIAPSSFGAFAGDLLVGNFGDGRINVFDPIAHTFLGQLSDSGSQPLVIDGLWALSIGNSGTGGSAGSSNKLYFTAGPNDEAHGLFGVIQAIPEPSSLLLLLSGAALLGGGRRRRA